jgi:hypothetical protein
MSKTEHIILRASPDFVELLKRTAAAEGVSRSEVIRRAVAEKDERMMGPPDGALRDIDLGALAKEDPYANLAGAARGDLTALRKLAVLAWAHAVAVDEEDGFPYLNYENGDPDLLIETSLTFSRLAAAHGYEEDVIALCNRLVLAAELAGDTDERMGEALGWIERSANAGSEKAARALNNIADDATPEAMEIAKQTVARLNQHVPIVGGGN